MKYTEEIVLFETILDYRVVNREYTPLNIKMSKSNGFNWFNCSFTDESIVLDFSKDKNNCLVAVNSTNEIVVYTEIDNYSTIKEYNFKNLPYKYNARVLSLIEELELEF